MTDMNELKDKFENFKEQRNWEKFHQPKNIAMSISIEASELMELFQWKDNVPLERIKQESDLMDDVKEELADVILYSMSMAQRLDIDLEEAVEQKLEENKERFDEETAKEITRDLDEWTR